MRTTTGSPFPVGGGPLAATLPDSCRCFKRRWRWQPCRRRAGAERPPGMVNLIVAEKISSLGTGVPA
jgi:hypothetical protein